MLTLIYLTFVKPFWERGCNTNIFRKVELISTLVVGVTWYSSSFFSICVFWCCIVIYCCNARVLYYSVGIYIFCCVDLLVPLVVLVVAFSLVFFFVMLFFAFLFPFCVLEVACMMMTDFVVGGSSSMYHVPAWYCLFLLIHLCLCLVHVCCSHHLLSSLVVLALLFPNVWSIKITSSVAMGSC